METALTKFVEYAQHQCAKNASIWNRTILLEAFMQGSYRVGQLTPMVVGVKLDKNAQFFHEIFSLLEWSV